MGRDNDNEECIPEIKGINICPEKRTLVLVQLHS
jgi:hypothetical protein